MNASEFRDLWARVIKNFQNITSDHKSRNSRARSHNSYFLYLTKLFRRCVSIATPGLRPITYLCISYWLIRRALFCWVYDKRANQCKHTEPVRNSVMLTKTEEAKKMQSTNCKIKASTYCHMVAHCFRKIFSAL